MPTVDCLIVRSGRLLMVRRPQGKTQPGMLLPIGGKVGPGESPLQACLREVREETGLHVAPSCAAVIANLTSGLAAGYGLTFIAELPAGENPSEGTEAELEWVALSDLPSRQDVPELDRELIPRLLASGRPLSVIVDVDTSTEPHTRRVVAVSGIDPARLSPLVFAVTS